jgi:hypothetical protein
VKLQPLKRYFVNYKYGLDCWTVRSVEAVETKMLTSLGGVPLLERKLIEGYQSLLYTN